MNRGVSHSWLASASGFAVDLLHAVAIGGDSLALSYVKRLLSALTMEQLEQFRARIVANRKELKPSCVLRPCAHMHTPDAAAAAAMAIPKHSWHEAGSGSTRVGEQ